MFQGTRFQVQGSIVVFGCQENIVINLSWVLVFDV